MSNKIFIFVKIIHYISTINIMNKEEESSIIPSADEDENQPTAAEAFQALTEALHAKKSNASHFAEIAEKTAKRSEAEGVTLSKNEASLKALNGLQYHIAKCCMPVPGDAITGIVTRFKVRLLPLKKLKAII